MTCPHHLGGRPDGLPCTRTEPHDPDAKGGHTYASHDVPDGRHDDQTGDY